MAPTTTSTSGCVCGRCGERTRVYLRWLEVFLLPGTCLCRGAHVVFQHMQGGKKSYQTFDAAEGKLFARVTDGMCLDSVPHLLCRLPTITSSLRAYTLCQGIWQKPTYCKFYNLLNNYEVGTGSAEVEMQAVSAHATSHHTHLSNCHTFVKLPHLCQTATPLSNCHTFVKLPHLCQTARLQHPRLDSHTASTPRRRLCLLIHHPSTSYSSHSCPVFVLAHRTGEARDL